MLQEVITELQVVEIKNKTKLITYNDHGDKFYVLLSGCVSVWVPLSLEAFLIPYTEYFRFLVKN